MSYDPTTNQVLAERWRRTRAILDQKGMEIPHTIEFRIDGANHIRATRVATLEELARAVAALDEVIERHSEGNANVLELRGRPKIGELNKQRDALAELQKLAGHDEAPSSTTVIEALFPDVPVQKRTPREKAEIEQWLTLRREEGLKIDPETAEVAWWYAQTLDPYGVSDGWSCRRSFIKSAANISPTLLGATFGFGSAIFPNRRSKGCGKEENQHSSTSGRLDE